MLLNLRDGFLAITTHIVGQAKLVEVGRDQHLVDLVVFDDEHMTGKGAKRPGSGQGLVRGAVFSGLLKAHREPEHAASAGIAFASHVTAHQAGQLPRN